MIGTFNRARARRKAALAAQQAKPAEQPKPAAVAPQSAEQRQTEIDERRRHGRR